MKRILVGCALALVTFTASGCSTSSSQLEGAVFAGKVPVVKNAQFDGQMGGTSYGDHPEDTSKGSSWFFTTEAPMDEVVAFYSEHLQGWTREEDSDGGEKNVTFTTRPEGAGEGEYMQVIISPGKVQIHESYNANREKSGASS